MTLPVQHQPKIHSLTCVWNKGSYQAETDLIYFSGRWLLCFEEHDVQIGVRLLSTKDGIHFDSVAFLPLEGSHLQPKLSVRYDGALTLMAKIREGTAVSVSRDAIFWSPWKQISEEDHIGRVVWMDGIGYAPLYRPFGQEWEVYLSKTEYGEEFEEVALWDMEGERCDAALRLFPGCNLAAFITKKDSYEPYATIGMSAPPYLVWEWYETEHIAASPNFLVTGKSEGWAASALSMYNPWGEFQKIAVSKIGLNYLAPKTFLPSFGHCGGVGMEWGENGELWVAYHSSHEQKTAIYFAKLRL